MLPQLRSASKMALCKVCFKEIPVGDGVMLGAFGRTLFEVHKEPCRALVISGMRAAGTKALQAGETYLQTKAPIALTAVKTFFQFASRI
jgi:hypothetical protein